MRKGQSLIEAMVAISILTVGFLGITTLLTKSFQLNRVAADQTKGTYLAAEGIEITKNILDYGVFNGIATGVAGWGKCFSITGYYQLDYLTNDCSITPIPFSLVSSPATIYFDPASGLYSNIPVGGSIKTIFQRDVYVEYKGDEIDVHSTVTWKATAFSSQSVTLEDHFYNWHPPTN